MSALYLFNQMSSLKEKSMTWDMLPCVFFKKSLLSREEPAFLCVDNGLHPCQATVYLQELTSLKQSMAKILICCKNIIYLIAAPFELEGAFFEGPQKFYISRAHEKSRVPRPLHNSFW